jgi:hypothetical protein
MCLFLKSSISGSSSSNGSVCQLICKDMQVRQVFYKQQQPQQQWYPQADLGADL